MAFKTFLIDAHKCEIREIEISGELADYYKHIGCDMIQHVPSYKEGFPDLYVDEEGLWNQTGLWWVYAGFPQPLCGNAIAIGTDSEGETIAPDVTLEKLKEGIRFVDMVKINGVVLAMDRTALEEG
jgi:hypothetical protein